MMGSGARYRSTILLPALTVIVCKLFALAVAPSVVIAIFALLLLVAKNAA